MARYSRERSRLGTLERGTGRTFFPVSHIRNGTPAIRVADPPVECI